MKRFAGLTALLLLCAAPAWADDCKLTRVASIDLTMMNSVRPMVAVTVNNTPEWFLLDTGGYITQISAEAARDLNLVTRASPLELHDVSGDVSNIMVMPDSMTFGTLKAEHPRIMVAPNIPDADGILSADLLYRYDIEMDFAGGKLNYFLPKDCPGPVVPWDADAAAAVPLQLRDRSLIIDVTLDGKPMEAVVDTGANRSTISLGMANGAFGLTPTSPGMDAGGHVNGDPSLVGYTHTFSTLAFEGVAVSKPKLLIIPDHVAGGAKALGSRLAPRDDLHLPQLILGMDIMRHLHIHMALKERVFYITPATTPVGKPDYLATLDKALAFAPANVRLLNERCFARALENIKLPEALADCDQALKNKPDNPDIIDSKGYVLYRLGRYEDSVAAYDRALALRPGMATALFVRGHAKKKLGNTRDGESDITAAKQAQANIEAVFPDMEAQ